MRMTWQPGVPTPKPPSGGRDGLAFKGLAVVEKVDAEAWRCDLRDCTRSGWIRRARILSPMLPLVHDPKNGVESYVAYGFFASGYSDPYCVPLPPLSQSSADRGGLVFYTKFGKFTIYATAEDGSTPARLHIESEYGHHVTFDKDGSNPEIKMVDSATVPMGRKGDPVVCAVAHQGGTDNLFSFFSGLAGMLNAAPVAPMDGGFVLSRAIATWILANLPTQVHGIIEKGTGKILAGSDTAE